MNFRALPGNQLFEGFCLIKSVEKKITAKGSNYLDFILTDTDGEISAKLWDVKDIPEMCFERFDFVKVRGSFVSFNDSQQFRIDRIRKVTPDDGVDINDYVPSACLSGEVMLEEIEKVIDDFSDYELKLFTRAVLDEYREKLIYWPAAKGLHHAIRGGLLMHTLSILRLAKAVCGVYTYVNCDLLCAGAILHDISKVDEIDSAETGVPGEYTVKGNLIGHLVLGAIKVSEQGKKLGISDDTVTLLEHMLISHHGVPEFGAAKVPMFTEAILLSMLDDMDAKMYESRAALLETEPGEFTQKLWNFDNIRLYNHGRDEDGGVELI
ncbi:MAG: HDIG domain-containing protein [Clostridia bacterium]|nr:HDIG domain-containing protein [Clostridia bacterium]